MPRIIVEREAKFRLINSGASVLVDGTRRGDLPLDGCADFLVTPGHHTIAVQVGLTLGHPIDFNCVEHETIKFVCHEPGFSRSKTYLEEVHRIVSHGRF